MGQFFGFPPINDDSAPVKGLFRNLSVDSDEEQMEGNDISVVKRQKRERHPIDFADPIDSYWLNYVITIT